MMERSAAALLCALLFVSACDPSSSSADKDGAQNKTAASALSAQASSTTTPNGSSGSATTPNGSSGSSASAAPQGVNATLAKEAGAQLAFIKHGKTVRALRKRELVESMQPETFVAYDPYYNKPKRFMAVPLHKVLAAGFKADDKKELESHHYVLKALDGYTVPMAGKRLLEEGGYLAIADVDVPQWQLIGPQQANPGPYYLVWRRKEQHDLTTHPRPWQLASIAIARFEDSFPHTAPGDEQDDSAAWRGYRLFSEQCIRCHAINREGGRVGPELNVPQNITEYRPAKQIRAYIRNPLAFRYGNMPQNPHLSDADLDDLLAYLSAMKTRKHDKDGADKGGGGH